MGRPIKNNADFFSHDADMRNDIKIKALRRRFSHTGYAVWCYILETLTDADFFRIDFNTVDQELLAADYDISVEDLQSIVYYCVKINLLQISEEETGKQLYCENLIARFSGLTSKRKNDRERLERWKKQRKSTSNKVIAAIIPDKDVNRPEKPHSKVKESKEEKNKVKESKEEKYPLQDIVDLWNSSCGNLPKVKLLNQKRRAKMKVRLQEFGKTVEEQRATVTDLFNRVQQSDFLRGDNNHHWTATFDWLFENGENWVKVMEGNYDNNRGRGAAQQTRTQAGTRLGVGEYITEDGRRTYGTGKATIPMSAKPRPSERYMWDSQTQDWILQ